MTASRVIPWGFMDRDTVVLSLGDDAPVAYTWTCYGKEDEGPAHVHSIGCLWVWHDCGHVYGPDTVEPGRRVGWGPAGVGAHTLHSIDPLHIEASVYWPACCGLHGFIRDGRWHPC